MPIVNILSKKLFPVTVTSGKVSFIFGITSLNIEFKKSKKPGTYFKTSKRVTPQKTTQSHNFKKRLLAHFVFIQTKPDISANKSTQP